MQAASPPAAVAAPATPAPAHLVAGTNAQRYAIVEGGTRRTVSEHEFRATFASCTWIEVLRYPSDTVVTHVCYR